MKNCYFEESEETLKEKYETSDIIWGNLHEIRVKNDG